MAKVIATHKNIKRQIEDNIKNPFDAFNEFIWNAIDAQAKNIHITVKHDSQNIKNLEISDDGNGINYEDLEEELFGKFNVSEKQVDKEKNHSLPRGEKGYGRFSFIQFSNSAEWITTYTSNKDRKKYQYSIKISDSSLDDFNPSKKEEVTGNTGTKVILSFTEMSKCKILTDPKNKNILNKLINSICLEFCWILELYHINIFINGKKINYNYLIEKKENTKLKVESYDFSLKFIKWTNQLKNEYSRYYFLDSKCNELFVKTTTLNQKGDEFYHSLYVSSDFFDHFDLFKANYDKVFRKLLDDLLNFLRKKRRPFIKNFSARKIKEFEQKNLFPKFDKFETQVKKPLYEKVVKEVIEFAPSLASNSNDSQRKILLQLIYRLLDDEESRRILYNILEVLVDDENKDQLEELERNLTKYSLKNILGTLKIIENRKNVIHKLRAMIDNEENYYLESDLQREIENHFWIFGEEYHLMLCAEEDDFTKLRNVYCEKILKLKKDEYENDAVSKRQVDLFICGIMPEGRLKKNLIVEIKKPNSFLKKENYRQIEDYKDIINNDSNLNSAHRKQWDFILMYKEISKDHVKNFNDIIKDETTGLAHDNHKNMRIFVIKWADLLDEVEFRLKFLNDSLEEKKSKLMPKKVEVEPSALEKFEDQNKT